MIALSCYELKQCPSDAPSTRFRTLTSLMPDQVCRFSHWLRSGVRQGMV